MTNHDSEPGQGINTVPAPLIGIATLMRQAHAGGDLTPLGQQLMQRAQANPADANALMDFSTILQLLHNRDLALAMQANALEIQQLYHQAADSGRPGLRLLAIKSPGDLMANTPLECLLEGNDVALDMLYMSPELPVPESIPDHDVLFVAVGESDRNQPLLTDLVEPLASWPRPVLNAPGRVAQLSRTGVSRLLASAPGLDMPVTVRIDRQHLARLAAGEATVTDFLDDGQWPIIVRPIGSHAGQDLSKLDTSGELGQYLAQVAADEFYISRFVDYRDADGQYRKYRIVLIEGRPFICHMGISSHWMIHYLNAGMTESAEKRAEEARFMAAFDQDFAVRHAAAFQALQDALGLDYVGIDCGESPDGRLLVFEADTAMVVHGMDPVDLFPYKLPQMQKVFAAFRQMLANAAQRQQA